MRKEKAGKGRKEGEGTKGGRRKEEARRGTKKEKKKCCNKKKGERAKTEKGK